MENGYGSLTIESTIDGSILWDEITQSDTLLQDIWKILNSKSWVISKKVGVSKELEKNCSSTKAIFNHFQKMLVTKNLCQ